MPKRLAIIFVLLGLTASAQARADVRPPIRLGVNIAYVPDSVAPLQSFVDAVGRPPAIVMWYQNWSEPLFYSKQLPIATSFGSEPLITWEPSLGGTPIPLRDIASGAYDRYIADSADLAKQQQGQIMIRFAHEMNLSGSPWGPGVGGNTPEDFVAAWRHVVDIFRERGVTNVQWVWSPNTDCSGHCPFAAFYPGDGWVDWVGLDGYNAGGTARSAGWRSLWQVFQSSYVALTAITAKPLMIAETGSTEMGGDKASWIRSGLVDDVVEHLPRVRALVWFDRNKETDWRIDSSAASLAAFKDVANMAMYGGSQPPVATIDSGPESTTTRNTATFDLTATVPDAVFECRLDGAAWELCSADATFGDLRAGSHALAVRASDVTGSVGPTSQSWSWTVEAPAPTPSPAPTPAPPPAHVPPPPSPAVEPSGGGASVATSPLPPAPFGDIHAIGSPPAAVVKTVLGAEKTLTDQSHWGIGDAVSQSGTLNSVTGARAIAQALAHFHTRRSSATRPLALHGVSGQHVLAVVTLRARGARLPKR